MTVTVLPNFWSELLGGFQQGNQMGQENYWRHQQMSREDARDERARQAQLFQTLLQANAQTGNVSHEQVNAVAAALAQKMPEYTQFKLSGPSRPELAQQIGRQEFTPSVVQSQGMPIPVPTRKFTDAQYALAGIETPEQRQLNKRLGTANLRTAESSATRNEFLAGMDVQALERSKMFSDVFGRIAPAVADQAIVRIGGMGKLTKDNIDTVATSAATELAKTDVFKQFGKLGDTHMELLKQQIASQLLDRAAQWYDQQTGRMSIQMRGITAMPEWARTVDKLDRDIEAYRKQINDLMDNNKFVAMYATGVIPPAEMEKLKRTNPTMYANVEKFKTDLNALRAGLDASQKQKLNIMSGVYGRDEIANRQGVQGLPVAPAQTEQLGIPGVKPEATSVVPQPAAVEPLTDAEIEEAVKLAESRPRATRRAFIQSSPFSEADKQKIIRRLGFDKP
jgi:hypothetical protein